MSVKKKTFSLENLRNLNIVKNQVAWVLEHFPETRDSDKKLMVKLYHLFYNIEHIEELMDKDVPSTETIRRSRQHYQALGLYLACDEVAAARFDMEEVYKTMVRSEG